MKLPLSIAAIVWATSLPLAVAAQAGAPADNPVTPPRTAQPQPQVTPRITPPLIKPKPLTVDPPALQGGKPAAPGGYNAAARRCESLSDIQQRNQCLDRVARETPVVRPPG